MPRRPRLDLPGLPQHVIQRGNNRQACFFQEQDYTTYLRFLHEHSTAARVEVHAYVLMTNHVHLLLSGQRHGAVSTLMQDMGRHYVRYINGSYGRSGTLWEGRFKTCHVQDERYLLTCLRYIELNPVRAGMVADPVDYRWSTYRHHAGVGDCPGLTPHSAYLALGPDPAQRALHYRALMAEALPNDEVGALRLHTQQGAPWGNDRFAKEITAMTGRRVSFKPQGRPRKKVQEAAL